MRCWIFLALLLLNAAAAGPASDIPTTLHIVHINDIHAHLDEFNAAGDDCSETERQTEGQCNGGYARIKAQIDKLRAAHPDNILVVNAGDQFQGTMFYTFYKGAKTAEILNRVHFDAITLGNHEFDDGPEHLAAYLKKLTSPVVCANVETSIAALRDALVPTLELPKLGVAIIGLLTTETKTGSSGGPDVDFLEPIKVVQPLIDKLRAKGYKRILGLTHIGFDEDQALVKATRGLSLVVGGDSHTRLGNVPRSEGPYPTVVKDLDGIDVPIVTDGQWGITLGHLEATFNEEGRVIAYAGQPIPLSRDAPKDAALEADIKAWKQAFVDYASQVIGYAEEPLLRTNCKYTECQIGDLVADAMLEAHPAASIALVNAGAFRADLPHGRITRGAILKTLPWGSQLVDIVLTGKALWQMFEGIVSGENTETGEQVTSFGQVDGVQVVYSSKRPKGQRLQALKIQRKNLSARMAAMWQDVDFKASYTLVTLDFIASGGCKFLAAMSGFVSHEPVDEAVVTYIQKHQRIFPKLDGRIRDTGLGGIATGSAEPQIYPEPCDLDLFL